MTIETELAALTVQTQALDDTIQDELIDVGNDINDLRGRVTALERANGVTGGGTGGGGTGGGGTGGGGETTGGGVTLVTTLPTTGTFVGETVYLESTGQLFVWDGTQWLDIKASLTPDAPASVTVVASLPGSAVDGTVVFNKADGYLYQRVNGAWVQVVVNVNTGAIVADASITVAKFAQGLRPVEIFDTLPTTNNVEGRLVFLTTDNKLYRYDGTNFINKIDTADLNGTIGADQIAANAITTGKIAAGAITASQIAADAINSNKIAAGSITSDKIVANAITADKVAAGAITTDKLAALSITAGKIAAGAIGTDQLAANSITSTIIASNAITAGKIAAGAVSADKLNVTNLSSINSNMGSITGGTMKLGSSGLVASTAKSAPSGWPTASAPGSAGSGARMYVASNGYSYFDTISVYGHQYSLTQTWRASVSSPLLHGQNDNSGGLGAKMTVNSGNSAFYADGGVYSPFTGSHECLLPKAHQVSAGDIMVDTLLVAKAGISETIFEVAKSSQPNQAAIGIFTVSHEIVPENHTPSGLKNLSETEVNDVAQTHDRCLVNALGEGQINVCGENGNIQPGDLIVTSSMPGKGMKQSDDLVRSYTVAKAREAAVFSSQSEVKQIACIYIAG